MHVFPLIAVAFMLVVSLPIMAMAKTTVLMPAGSSPAGSADEDNNYQVGGSENRLDNDNGDPCEINPIYFEGKDGRVAPSPSTRCKKDKPVEHTDDGNVVSSPPMPSPSVMCTQEAMLCPNGVYVGRSGEKCEFVCPK